MPNSSRPVVAAIMRSCTRSFLMKVGLTLLLLGCEEGGGHGAPGELTRTQFASSYCELFAPCCSKINALAQPSLCRENFTWGEDYREDRAKACLSELRQAASTADLCSLPQMPAACSEALRGKIPLGEVCAVDLRCAPSDEGKVVCQRTAQANVQRHACQLQIPGLEGDNPCGATIDGRLVFASGPKDSPVPPRAYSCDVRDGLACSSKNQACTRIQPLGAACTDSTARHACEAGSHCNPATKKCAADAAAGTPCAFGTQCAIDAYCDRKSETCLPKGAEGDACENQAHCLSRSCGIKNQCEALRVDRDPILSVACGIPY